MADEITIRSRIPQKIDTTANWEASTLILKNGEIGIEELTDGTRKFKFGDGTSSWSDLDYVTGDALTHIADGTATGSVRTSSSTAESTSYSLGTAAFSEGSSTKASGNYSHAEGYSTTASGAYSHAEGRSSTASGSVSHAQGTDTVASGIRSHAGGYGTIAAGENQTAIGKYNVEDSDNEYAFIVGGGSSALARSNIFTVDWDGNAAAGGSTLATQDYVEENGGKIDSIEVNGTALTIDNKTVDITVPTKTSELTNDSGFLTSHQDISGLAEKATTLAGYGITDAYTQDETDSAITTQIAALDKADTAVSGSYVSAVSETDGIISVTRASLPDYSSTYDAAGAAAAVLGSSTDASTAATVYGARALADSKVANVTGADASISTSGTTDISVGVNISSNSDNALSLASDGLMVSVPSSSDYTVTVTESTTSSEYSKVYTIAQAATGLSATINIPKDMVVSSGTVETKTSSGEWGLAGTYLVLTLANADSDTVYIDVSNLIEYVTSGSSSGDQIQIVVDSSHQITATLADSSVTKAQLSSDLQTQITKLEGVESGAQANVQSDWNATSGDAYILNKPTLFSGAYSDLTGTPDLSSYATQDDVSSAVADVKNTWYGTCSTEAATAAKVVTTTTGDFELVEGNSVTVLFANANTGSSPTLNVDGTGDVTIYRYGTTVLASNMWRASTAVEFVYNGSAFVMLYGTCATTTYYGLTKLSSSYTSTSTTTAATPAAVNSVYSLCTQVLTATVPASGWSSSTTDGWYTNQVTVSGMSASYNPLLDLVITDADSASSERSAFSQIYECETFADYVIFRAIEVPTIDLNVRFLGV